MYRLASICLCIMSTLGMLWVISNLPTNSLVGFGLFLLCFILANFFALCARFLKHRGTVVGHRHRPGYGMPDQDREDWALKFDFVSRMTPDDDLEYPTTDRWSVLVQDKKYGRRWYSSRNPNFPKRYPTGSNYP